MIVCGLKLTHDGAVAVIDEDRLVCSVEIEKLANNPRYSDIRDTRLIDEILGDHGLKASEVDRFVIDGWGGYDPEALAIQPRLTIGRDMNRLNIRQGGADVQLEVAQYQERSLQNDVLECRPGSGLYVGGKLRNYLTTLHVAGHIMSAYCTSDFARAGESSYILVWDGGMFPRLYYFDATKGKMSNLGPLFLLIGNIYTIFAQHFGPFKVSGGFAKDELSVAGKVMAYIALGTLRRELFPVFDDIYSRHYDHPMGFANTFAVEFRKRVAGGYYSDEDILCSFHVYLEELLVSKLIKKIQRQDTGCRNLCMAGGCALNIKWNSAVRNSGFFQHVYVPPFPNDSGSAIGAACTAIFRESRKTALEWSVYSGPAMIGEAPVEWEAEDCSIAKLAQLLHETGEPVLLLHGNAELGPRALGNRSIIAPAVSPAMKDLLNVVKERENYRPVSPICVEERAPEIFIPGTPDPFMVFDHMVREEWLDRIPATCHLDGSGRLQTVNRKDNPVVYELLTEYDKLSGIPVLCNTSANYKGKGFFPDLGSAAEWGNIQFIWNDQRLYTAPAGKHHRPATIDSFQTLLHRPEAIAGIK